ncbi:MAG: AAA family ATPase [Polyangiaceae bacterium]|nr:AAA family ATPase [Polyangiaceae bacterium]
MIQRSVEQPDNHLPINDQLSFQRPYEGTENRGKVKKLDMRKLFAVLSAEMESDSNMTSPRLAKISLDGIGPFQGATFEPIPAAGRGELVLFEGPNGCGKTTLLEAIAVLVGAAGKSFGWESDWVSRSAEENHKERLRFLGQTPVPGGLLPTVPPVTAFLRRLRGGGAGADLEFDTGGVAFSSAAASEVKWRTAPISEVKEFQECAATNTPTSWAVFSYRGSVSTAKVETEGPKRIERPLLRGVLSFGELFPASDDLGQILVNLYFDQLHALSSAERVKGTAQENEFRAAAAAHQAALDRIPRALSELLDRQVTIDFQFRQRPPEVRLDGQIVPLDLLGEGFRRTIAWVSDLCTRLEMTPWKDTSRSPFDQDFWLLLDEIDQSLHPRLQVHILPTLRRLFPNARIYATTHSPFVVASAPDGCVFPIRPNPSNHLVEGRVAPVKLGTGHSLTWTIEEVFDVPSAFVDEATIERLKKHKEAVDKLRHGELGGFDWAAFAALRAPLIEAEGDGRAIVMLTEHRIRALIDEHLANFAVSTREKA